MSSHGPTKGIKYGMVIDLDKCTGCGTCSVACMTENNVYTLDDESDKIRSITWMRVYRLENGKPFPETKVVYMPRPCMHCDNHPPCVSVCPPTATTKDEVGGIVSQITTRCIGCRYCMAACPYHARYFNWFDPWPLYKDHVKQMTNGLNPDVAPRMRGVVEKCTFCHHRLMAAKERVYAEGKHEIPEDYFQTACTQACPAGAITFGDLNNPKHKIHKLLVERKADSFRLLEKLGTEPKVYYLSTQKWVRQKADNYLEVPQGTGY
ncbi:MAG: menaquinone reductase iron-sulfur cluster-binding subunit QrcC [Thermodesulfobacteriota bacterium]|nr:menaquinone reductase iron-sulfur cluster-binding subunit QrcC [Thermodesulfobacteriota bacterium]